MRYLRVANLLPPGEKGTRRNKDQYEPKHYVNCLLSFGALQSLDGPSAAVHLRKAVFTPAWHSPDVEAEYPGDLGEVLEAMLRHQAHLFLHQFDENPPKGTRRGLPDYIGLQTNPYVANLVWLARPDRPQKTLTYIYTAEHKAIGTTSSIALTRETKLSSTMLSVAACLWAATVSNTDHGPRNENASDLAGSEAPTCTHTDQPRDHGTEAHTSENRRMREKSQSSRSRRTDRTPSTMERSHGPSPNPYPASP